MEVSTRAASGEGVRVPVFSHERERYDEKNSRYTLSREGEGRGGGGGGRRLGGEGIGEEEEGGEREEGNGEACCPYMRGASTPCLPRECTVGMNVFLHRAERTHCRAALFFLPSFLPSFPLQACPHTTVRPGRARTGKKCCTTRKDASQSCSLQVHSDDRVDAWDGRDHDCQTDQRLLHYGCDGTRRSVLEDVMGRGQARGRMLILVLPSFPFLPLPPVLRSHIVGGPASKRSVICAPDRV